MISAVILAAGKSERFDDFKQLVEIDGKPMLDLVIEKVRNSSVDEIITVLGYKSDRILSKISTEGSKFVMNPNYERGMSTSLSEGLEEVGRNTDAVVILLGDQPYLDSEVIDKLIRSYQNSDKLVMVPYYQGKRGNPVLFDISLKEELMEVEGDVGGRKVVEENPELVHKVAVDNPGVLMDIDTRKDIERVKEHGGLLD